MKLNKEKLQEMKEEIIQIILDYEPNTEEECEIVADNIINKLCEMDEDEDKIYKGWWLSP